MNACKFLVPAVHEIAIAAELAITTSAAEKSDTHALTNRPALDTRTKGVDLTDDLMARTRGQSIGNSPSTVAESEWQTPHASTRMRT
jgi:hypothetical protein